MYWTTIKLHGLYNSVTQITIAHNTTEELGRKIKKKYGFYRILLNLLNSCEYYISYMDWYDDFDIIWDLYNILLKKTINDDNFIFETKYNINDIKTIIQKISNHCIYNIISIFSYIANVTHTSHYLSGRIIGISKQAHEDYHIRLDYLINNG